MYQQSAARTRHTVVTSKRFPALLAAGAGVAVLVVASALAWNERVPSWEANLFDALNGLPDSVGFALWPVMQLGMIASAVIVPAIALALLRRWPPAAAAALAAISAWLLAKVVKDIVERGRPPLYAESAQVREGDGEGLGFVSGHAAVSAALVAALWPYLSWRLRVVGVLLAALVGAARVFYGAHLPLDIVGGAALGGTCGALACAAIGSASTSYGSVRNQEPLTNEPGTR